MERIDRVMLIAAATMLGVLLLESAKPLLAGGAGYYFDKLGFPLVGWPFRQALALGICLWFRRITLCRVLLALGGALNFAMGIVLTVLALSHFQHLMAKYGSVFFVDLVVECLYLFGFFALLWISFRPGPERPAPAVNFLRHARA